MAVPSRGAGVSIAQSSRSRPPINGPRTGLDSGMRAGKVARSFLVRGSTGNALRAGATPCSGNGPCVFTVTAVSREPFMRNRIPLNAILITAAVWAWALPPGARADDSVPIPASDPRYDWTGLYLGAHLGAAWGRSSWTAGPGIGGSHGLNQAINLSDEGGSWFAGVQGGYNYVLPNRWLLGAEVDLSAPSWPKLATGVNPFGLSIGSSSSFTSPTLGAVSFAETVQASGTARARVGYAAGD